MNDSVKRTIEEFSSGGVVYKKKGKGYQLLIGKHSGYHKWVLPKGLVEKGESPEEAAVREVMEELGVEGRIVDMVPLGSVEYYYHADLGEVVNKNPHIDDTSRRVTKYQEEGGTKVRVHKRVVFYLMECVDDKGDKGWEMEDKKWLPYEEALDTLAFDGEREVLESAGKALDL